MPQAPVAPRRAKRARGDDDGDGAAAAKRPKAPRAKRGRDDEGDDEPAKRARRAPASAASRKRGTAQRPPGPQSIGKRVRLETEDEAAVDEFLTEIQSMLDRVPNPTDAQHAIFERMVSDLERLQSDPDVTQQGARKLEAMRQKVLRRVASRSEVPLAGAPPQAPPKARKRKAESDARPDDEDAHRPLPLNLLAPFDEAEQRRLLLDHNPLLGWPARRPGRHAGEPQAGAGTRRTCLGPPTGRKGRVARVDYHKLHNGQIIDGGTVHLVGVKAASREAVGEWPRGAVRREARPHGARRRVPAGVPPDVGMEARSPCGQARQRRRAVPDDAGARAVQHRDGRRHLGHAEGLGQQGAGLSGQQRGHRAATRPAHGPGAGQVPHAGQGGRQHSASRTEDRRRRQQEEARRRRRCRQSRRPGGTR